MTKWPMRRIFWVSVVLRCAGGVSDKSSKFCIYTELDNIYVCMTMTICMYVYLCMYVCMYVCIGVFDIVIVKRWNRAVGISDKAMYMVRDMIIYYILN